MYAIAIQYVTPNYFLDKMTDYELINLLKMHNDKYKDEWERVRLLAFYQVNSMVGGYDTPMDLFKFGWDEVKAVKVESNEDVMKRMQKLLEKID